MGLREIFTLTRQSKTLIAVLVCLCAVGIAIAYFYYDYQNKAEDPRIIEARKKMIRYDDLMKEKNFNDALLLMDSIHDIYSKTHGYEGSFEFGVIYNNRCSVFLSLAIYDSTTPSEDKKNLLLLAEENALKSIAIYQHWIDSVGSMTEAQIRRNIAPAYTNDDIAFHDRNLPRIIDKRVEDIVNAQLETPRRLSVSYTNLGIVQRHQLRLKEAGESYIEAMKLWKDNYTARNNFNVLMGRPTEDRSIIDQLFPPERLKKD